MYSRLRLLERLPLGFGVLPREGEVTEQALIATLLLALGATPTATRRAPAASIAEEPLPTSPKVVVVRGVLISVRLRLEGRCYLTGGETSPVDGGKEGVSLDALRANAILGLAGEQLCESGSAIKRSGDTRQRRTFNCRSRFSGE